MQRGPTAVEVCRPRDRSDRSQPSQSPSGGGNPWPASQSNFFQRSMFTLTRLTFQRARKERLPQVAGSLTFTTLLSIVPLLAASFALFTHFPIFRRFKDALQE